MTVLEEAIKEIAFTAYKIEGINNREDLDIFSKRHRINRVANNLLRELESIGVLVDDGGRPISKIRFCEERFNTKLETHEDYFVRDVWHTTIPVNKFIEALMGKKLRRVMFVMESSEFRYV